MDFYSNIDLHNCKLNNADFNINNKNVCVVSNAVPSVLSKGSTFLYIGDTTTNFKNNTFYTCNDTTWEEMGSVGGDGIKVVDTLPTPSVNNKGQVFLYNNSIYKSDGKNNTIIGYINSFVDKVDNPIKNILYFDSEKGFYYYDGKELKSILSLSSINDLGDTNISGVKDGDVLCYDKDNTKWINKSLVFDNNTIATKTIGGVSKDADLSGMNYFEVFKLMLTGSIDPANLTLNDIKTVYKKGETIDQLTVTATSKSSDIDLVKIEFLLDNVVKYTKTLSGRSATTTYIFENISTDCTIEVKLTLANGETSVADRNVKFIIPSYYGIEGDLTEITLEAKGVVLVFNYGDTLVQPIYKYPASYGLLTKITDESEVDDYTNSFEQSTETIGEVEYYVYKKIVASQHKNFKYWFR